jgi:hypothetical protein
VLGVNPGAALLSSNQEYNQFRVDLQNFAANILSEIDLDHIFLNL